MKWNQKTTLETQMLNCSAQELRQNLNLQGKESVLDVGCGDGKITADFARLLPRSRVTGVDSSPEMLMRLAPMRQSSIQPFFRLC